MELILTVIGFTASIGVMACYLGKPSRRRRKKLLKKLLKTTVDIPVSGQYSPRNADQFLINYLANEARQVSSQISPALLKLLYAEFFSASVKETDRPAKWEELKLKYAGDFAASGAEFPMYPAQQSPVTLLRKTTK